jgi:hypothetical protein
VTVRVMISPDQALAQHDALQARADVGLRA